jgi:hypothetical protein
MSKHVEVDAIFVGADYSMLTTFKNSPMKFSLEQITECLRPQQFTDAIFVEAKVAHLSIV